MATIYNIKLTPDDDYALQLVWKTALGVPVSLVGYVPSLVWLKADGSYATISSGVTLSLAGANLGQLVVNISAAGVALIRNAAVASYRLRITSGATSKVLLTGRVTVM